MVPSSVWERMPESPCTRGAVARVKDAEKGRGRQHKEDEARLRGTVRRPSRPSGINFFGISAHTRTWALIQPL